MALESLGGQIKITLSYLTRSHANIKRNNISHHFSNKIIQVNNRIRKYNNKKRWNKRPNSRKQSTKCITTKEKLGN